MSPSGQRRPGVAVILKGYPRLSETFIAQELLGLERRGFRLHLISMRHPTDAKRHPIHDEIQAPVTYLPEYLHQEPLRVMRGLWAARRLPGFRAALGQFWRDLKRDVSRNRFRRFGQAAVLVTELPGGTEHLYAHFIHTPASVTHYAHLMTGLPWSCSAHAKDIWTSPAIDLEGKLISADWVATCTRIGAEHLTDLAGPAGDVHLIYHGLDLARFPSPPARTSTRDGSNADTPVRLLTVGRAVAKKGFDVLLDALARLPDETAWQLTHIGGGTELRALKAQADRLAIADRIDWQGARDQADVLAAYRASDLFV
ncbi:MAG: glycosyltransferase, partial [Pseudomonadota bacterium]